MYFNLIDIRDVARAHVFLLEHEEAEGRYIVAIDQYIATKSWYKIGEDIVAADDLRSLPVAKFEMPAWFVSLMVWLKVDSRVGKRAAEVAYFGPTCGYFGSKISRELGFEYKYFDMKVSVQDTARSMIKLGIVDGKSHMEGSIVALSIGIVLIPVILMLVVWWLCCCQRRKVKKD